MNNDAYAAALAVYKEATAKLTAASLAADDALATAKADYDAVKDEVNAARDALDAAALDAAALDAKAADDAADVV